MVYQILLKNKMYMTVLGEEVDEKSFVHLDIETNKYGISDIETGLALTIKKYDTKEEAIEDFKRNSNRIDNFRNSLIYKQLVSKKKIILSIPKQIRYNDISKSNDLKKLVVGMKTTLKELIKLNFYDKYCIVNVNNIMFKPKDVSVELVHSEIKNFFTKAELENEVVILLIDDEDEANKECYFYINKNKNNEIDDLISDLLDLK